MTQDESGKFLVWELCIDGRAYPLMYIAETEGGVTYCVANDYDRSVGEDGDWGHTFHVDYFRQDDDEDETVLATGVATATEAKAVALRHYRQAT